MPSQTHVSRRVDQAEQAYRALTAEFYDANTGLFLEHSRSSDDSHQTSYLWPYAGVLSAMNALAAVPSLTDKYLVPLKSCFKHLEAYWNPSGPVAGYDSCPQQRGFEARFYDDNEWIGMELLAGFKRLGDELYFHQARQVFKYVTSGWSDELGGGIYWKEGDTSTKNTCSNGPGAVLALQLYQIDHDPSLVSWAERILDWCKRLKDPATGTYWDHVNSDGSIEPTKWTYNTGSILHANVLLHTLTGDSAALQEAQRLAVSSLATFTRLTGEHTEYPAMPWFNVVLLRGYIALRDVDRDLGEQCINAFQSYVDGAWSNGPDDHGLFSGNWMAPINAKPARWLLDHAAMIEAVARLAVS